MKTVQYLTIPLNLSENILKKLSLKNEHKVIFLQKFTIFLILIKNIRYQQDSFEKRNMFEEEIIENVSIETFGGNFHSWLKNITDYKVKELVPFCLRIIMRMLTLFELLERYCRDASEELYRLILKLIRIIFKLENISLFSFLFLLFNLPLLKIFKIFDSEIYDQKIQISNELYNITKEKTWVIKYFPIQVETLYEYFIYILKYFYNKYILKLKLKPSLYKDLALNIIERNKILKRLQVLFVRNKIRQWAWNVIKSYDGAGLNKLIKLVGFTTEDMLRNIDPHLYHTYLLLESTGRNPLKALIPGTGLFFPAISFYWDQFFPTIWELPVPDSVLEDINQESFLKKIVVKLDNLTPDNSDTIIEQLYKLFCLFWN
jgi:hypothetical protein